MGVIIRQSVKQTLFTFVGSAVGMISTLFIYNRAISVYGMAGYLMDTAMLLSSFLFWGILGCYIRFFPRFQEPEKFMKAQGLQTFFMLMVAIAGIFSALIIYFFSGSIGSFLKEKGIIDFSSSPEIIEYSFYIFPLAFLMALSSMLTEFGMVAKRTAVQGIFDLYIKLSLPLYILLYIFEIVSVKQVVWGILLTYTFVLVSQIIFLWRIKAWDLKFNSTFFEKSFVYSFFTFSIFHLLGGIGSQMALRMDSLLISSMLGFEANGQFKIAYNIINVMQIPLGSIISISAPIIADALTHNRISEVENVYKKSALNLFIVGLFIYLGTLLCFDDLLSIIKNGDKLIYAKTIVILLGLGRLIDLVTGVNDTIIGYSKYFKYTIVFVLLLGLLNYFLNKILIPRYDVIGCALATLLALGIYNFFKLIFIWWKFKIHPFELNILKILMLGLLLFAVLNWLPFQMPFWLNILIKGSIFSFGYLAALIYFDISPDLTRTLGHLWNRIKSLNLRA